ncbi:MAG TPA: hypothetical protein VIV12_02105 [Streptosporangiaceae bacterium]
MTELATRDLTVDEAREFVEHVRASVDDLKDWIVRAVRGRAWVALGYSSWDQMCEAEFDGAVIRLPREDRRDAVASLREAGLSTRAIAGALGVHKDTVRNDLSTGENSPVPDSVTSLDGRQRPATQAPRMADRYAEAIAEFPELEHFADRPQQAVATAAQLRSMDQPEREMRRENLGRYIEAEAEGRLDDLAKPDPSQSILARARSVFTAINTAAQDLRKRAPEEALTEAIAHADPIEVDVWHAEFAAMADLCGRLAEASRSKLRRVK